MLDALRGAEAPLFHVAESANLPRLHVAEVPICHVLTSRRTPHSRSKSKGKIKSGGQGVSAPHGICRIFERTDFGELEGGRRKM